MRDGALGSFAFNSKGGELQSGESRMSDLAQIRVLGIVTDAQRVAYAPRHELSVVRSVRPPLSRRGVLDEQFDQVERLEHRSDDGCHLNGSALRREKLASSQIDERAREEMPCREHG